MRNRNRDPETGEFSVEETDEHFNDQIHFKLSARLKKHLDEYCELYELSRSEAIREAIRILVTSEPEHF